MENHLNLLRVLSQVCQLDAWVFEETIVKPLCTVFLVKQPLWRVQAALAINTSVFISSKWMCLSGWQINGENVVRASHERVVQLIRSSGNDLVLKVVTVRPAMEQHALSSDWFRHQDGSMTLPPRKKLGLYKEFHKWSTFSFLFVSVYVVCTLSVKWGKSWENSIVFSAIHTPNTQKYKCIN